MLLHVHSRAALCSLLSAFSLSPAHSPSDGDFAKHLIWHSHLPPSIGPALTRILSARQWLDGAMQAMQAMFQGRPKNMEADSLQPGAVTLDGHWMWALTQ